MAEILDFSHFFNIHILICSNFIKQNVFILIGTLGIVEDIYYMGSININNLQPVTVVGGSGSPKQVTEKEISFSKWKFEADSMTVFDENGPNCIGNVQDYDMAGDEFRRDIYENGGKNALEIYRKSALKLAKEVIADTDIDGDGTMDPDELIKLYIKETENVYGKLNEYDAAQKQEEALRMLILIDLDKDRRITPEKYAAFIYAMDSNNAEGNANGKISQKEYISTKAYFKKKMDTETICFKDKIRDCYNRLFGNNTAPVK